MASSRPAGQSLTTARAESSHCSFLLNVRKGSILPVLELEGFAGRIFVVARFAQSRRVHVFSRCRRRIYDESLAGLGEGRALG
ncbi:hypothetical protein MES5069_480035 [Mesorhizobium escarrei]|uniref:Uncharacterized protein n=1 Tax=Mesorhizobium escarrei TaxID=666018 RepID=A0ABN8K5W3_9HYPH|nr:hypothetical protein MES5069_480035 [Mesorhizobium escarrei]